MATFDKAMHLCLGDIGSDDAKMYRRFLRYLKWKTRDNSGQVWAIPDAPAGVTVSGTLFPGADTSSWKSIILESPNFKERQTLELEVAFDYADDVYSGLESVLNEQPIWKSFHTMALTLTTERTERPVEFLVEIFIPWFFSRFPSGRIDFIEPFGPFTSRMHAVRKLVQVLIDPSAAKTVGVPATLSRLHGFGRLYWPADEVSIWGSLLWPYITAIPLSLWTCGLMFHLGEAWDTREPYPPSLDRWWRDESLFDERGDIVATAKAFASAESLPEFFDDHNQVVAALNDPAAFSHYLERVSRVRELTADFRIFAHPGSRKPDFSQNLQLLLTYQRIVASTHYLCNYAPPFVGKGLLFDVADEFATMLEVDEALQASWFEWLFDSELGGNWTVSALKKLPGIGEYFSKKAAELYGAVDSSIKAGLKAPVKSSHPHLLRLLRNSRHGYWFRKEGVTADLANYDANLSDDAPKLAMFWWLAFLEEPWQMVRRDADSGLVHEYGSS